MHTRRLAAALLSLISLQIVGSLSFIASDVRAQSNELVAVMSLYTGRDVCEVQFRKSDNDQWGEESREGPPIACPGGIVVTEILTQEEANQIASASEDGLMSGPNAGTDPVEVRVVVLSGDASADDEAIQGEISNLHETAAAESGSLPVDQAQFMAPEVLDAFLPTQPELGAAALAADCRQGRVGQERRADFAWNQKRIGVTVKAYLYYKRVSCANWKTGRSEESSLVSLPTTTPCGFGSEMLSTPRSGARPNRATFRIHTGSTALKYSRAGGRPSVLQSLSKQMVTPRSNRLIQIPIRPPGTLPVNGAREQAQHQCGPICRVAPDEILECSSHGRGHGCRGQWRES